MDGAGDYEWKQIQQPCGYVRVDMRMKGSYSYGILLTELLARIVPFSDTYSGFDFINDVATKNQLPTIPMWCVFVGISES